jgi:hypothetical protein
MLLVTLAARCEDRSRLVVVGVTVTIIVFIVTVAAAAIVETPVVVDAAIDVDVGVGVSVCMPVHLHEHAVTTTTTPQITTTTVIAPPSVGAETLMTSLLFVIVAACRSHEVSAVTVAPPSLVDAIIDTSVYSSIADVFIETCAHTACRFVISSSFSSSSFSSRLSPCAV